MTSYYVWREIVLMPHFAHLKGSVCIIHKALKPCKLFRSLSVHNSMTPKVAPRAVKQKHFDHKSCSVTHE